MNVAVGRLQLSITLTSPRDREATHEPDSHVLNAAEKAYRRDQNRRAIEADKLRWISRYPMNR